MSDAIANAKPSANGQSPPTLDAPPRDRSPWFALAVFALLACVPFWLSDDPYRLEQITKFTTLALFALSVDLIWGYTGLMSLGQGLYFGIGAYAIGYSLILQKVEQRGAEMPDFMFQCRLPEVPGWIALFNNIWFAWAVAVILPPLTALVFGGLVFYRRIKGVYFSLITQAVLLAVFELIRNQRPYTGGVDGLTNLARMTIFGFEFRRYDHLFFLVFGFLLVSYVGCALLMRSKVGKLLTAIRDNEYRVLALGYNTAMYKTFIFVLAALLAGLAGGLYVAVNNSAGPQFLDIPTSILVLIFVAVGGRGTLIGAVIGTLLVCLTQTYANEYFTSVWPIILGCLFIGITVFLPDGVVGGVKRLLRSWSQERRVTELPSAPHVERKDVARQVDAKTLGTETRGQMSDLRGTKSEIPSPELG